MVERYKPTRWELWCHAQKIVNRQYEAWERKHGWFSEASLNIRDMFLFMIFNKLFGD